MYTTNSLQPFLIKSSKTLGDQYCTMVLKTESPSRLDRDGKNFMLQFYDVLSCKNTYTSKEKNRRELEESFHLHSIQITNVLSNLS